MTQVASVRLPITLRPPAPDDATGVLRIVRAHGLPDAWAWPEGKHGLVAEREGHLLAFAILSETIYGLVIEELWEEPSREGIRALSLLGTEIEAIAQRLANERGVALACGGIVRLDRAAHIGALKKRGFGECATILEKVYSPERG